MKIAYDSNCGFQQGKQMDKNKLARLSGTSGTHRMIPTFLMFDSTPIIYIKPFMICYYSIKLFVVILYIYTFIYTLRLFMF